MQMRHIDAVRFAISAIRPRFLREPFAASRLRRMIIASSARRAFVSAIKFAALKLDPVCAARLILSAAYAEARRFKSALLVSSG